MNETDIRIMLHDLFSGCAMGDEIEQVKWVKSFGEQGLLTGDEGVTIRMLNGAEFQLSICQTKKGGD